MILRNCPTCHGTGKVIRYMTLRANGVITRSNYETECPRCRAAEDYKYGEKRTNNLD
jgi:DnaJ-class molecular chaperone